MPSFDRDTSYSDETLFKILEANPLPPRARVRLISLRGLAANFEMMADAFWNQKQKLQDELRTQKHLRDVAQDAGSRKRLAQTVINIEKRITDLNDSRETAGSINTEFTDAITRDAVKLVRSKKPLKDFDPELPEQSASADVKMLAEQRAGVAVVKKKIDGLETAFASPADVMRRLQRDLDKFAAAGTPDFGNFIQEERRGDGLYAPVGPIHWPRQYVGDNHFASDGMAFVFWLFKDEVRKRIESEITRITAGRRIVPIAERPALITKLESQIVTLERVESALVWRLQDKGRIDITHRRDVNFKALLGIKVGKVVK